MRKEAKPHGENPPLRMDMNKNIIKISSTGLILHLNELNEQLLGDRLGEVVVNAKIMHQCINVL